MMTEIGSNGIPSQMPLQDINILLLEYNNQSWFIATLLEMVNEEVYISR